MSISRSSYFTYASAYFSKRLVQRVNPDNPIPIHIYTFPP